MLILTRDDVASVLTMADTIEAVEAGFARLSEGEVVMPQRTATTIAPHSGLHLTMPAYVSGDPGALTVKIVTVYGDNPSKHGLPMIQGALLLHEARTGTLLALMDAEHVTAMRTGAASAVATKYMARKDAQTLALFGAGAQAAAQMEAVCAVRSIDRAFVVTRSGEKDARFCAEMSDRLNMEVYPSRDARSVVEAADVICMATSSTTPVFDGGWVQPGTHINAIGAYSSSMCELDASAVRRSRVIVDHHTAAQAEAGDILLAIEEGAFEYGSVAGQLGDVVTGAVPGRTSDDEITLFKSVGLAMQDAMTAALVFAKATQLEIGLEVDL